MMKKFLFLTALVLYLAMAPLPTLSATNNASDMDVGAWTTDPRYMKFGDYNGHPLLWRVLEVKDNDSDFGGVKTAFLLLDDLLRDRSGNQEMMIFDSSNNCFPNSKIKEWLNDGKNGFLANLEAYKEDILDTTYSPDNRPRRWSGNVANGTSKVFLLSVGEAGNNRYFANNDDRVVENIAWWLRSPGFENNIAAFSLSDGGIAKNGNYTDSLCCVRPALKINLSSSSAFASLPVSYGLTVSADAGNNPIPGAKFSLTNSLSVYSNTAGMARFASVYPGEYTITVSKPGYITKSEIIAVPEVTKPTISLTIDTLAMPDKVKFGKYNEIPIEWSVLDIVNGKALLLADPLFQSQFDMRGSSEWASSSLRAQLNGNKAGDFLQDSNFSAEESAAVDAAASGDSVFLLSREEVFRYLPDANMRRYDDKDWLMRSALNEEDVEVISPDGEYGSGIPAYNRNILAWVRPAMWLDLSGVSHDFSSNTLAPAHKKLDEVP
jgi:hypothetical protein